MAKILNLIIQERSDSNDPRTFVESYEIRDDVQNPEKAFRDAIQAFVNSDTDESKSALSYACGCFNWGDALSSVPDSAFTKHGLTPLKQNTIDVFVDHDEILVNNSSDEPIHKIKSIIKSHIKKGEKDSAFWNEGENLVAEGIADAIAIQNEKLTALLALDDITEETIIKLIEAETDDNLIVIYEDIRDSIADIAMS